MAARFAATLFLTTIVAQLSCAQPAPAPAPAGDLDLKAAAQQVANDLAQQIGAGGARTMVVDPILDRATGQQTGASASVESELSPALSTAARSFTILPFDADAASRTRFVLTGTVSMVTAPDHYSMSASLTERSTGIVVAQSAARFVQTGLDNAPTRFYNDSPVLVRDRSVEGYLKTAETPKGAPADALYVEQLPTAALLSQALAAYNAENWNEALTAYTAAAARSDGQQLRTFNGIYLSNARLGRMDAAAEAFGKIAALGLATNNLAVKILFRPNSATEFFPGRELSDVYPIWLRQIARAAQTTNVCLEITGHTSRSGSEQVNDRISLARADNIKSLMVKEVPALASKLQVAGVGYRENIIGTGADDASDAVDRRVEFKVVDCRSS